jgi:SAM-dependent methyltransferase
VTSLLRADITALSPLAAIDFEDEWYETTSPTHFWMQWRFEAFRRQLDRVRAEVGVPLRGLDVGGGHGILRAQLEATTPWRVDVADINAGALNRCPPGRGAILCYDVMQTHPDLVGRYDALFLFDVLEHIQRSGPFLAAALAHVRPGGRLFINVPALQSLFSGYDSVLGHYRRYRKSTLVAEFAGLPVRIDDMQYWGVAMLPLLALRACLMRRAPIDAAERGRLARRGCEPPSRLTDRFLRRLMRLEAAISPRPPVGTSILCACTRL